VTAGVKRDVPARPDIQPLHNGDMTVEQLKQLVEIQTQIVKQAQQVEHAKRNRTTFRRKLAGTQRRLLRFLSQIW
jgi:hypothetical protein